MWYQYAIWHGIQILRQNSSRCLSKEQQSFHWECCQKDSHSRSWIAFKRLRGGFLKGKKNQRSVMDVLKVWETLKRRTLYEAIEASIGAIASWILSGSEILISEDLTSRIDRDWLRADYTKLVSRSSLSLWNFECPINALEIATHIPKHERCQIPHLHSSWNCLALIVIVSRSSILCSNYLFEGGWRLRFTPYRFSFHCRCWAYYCST